MDNYTSEPFGRRLMPKLLDAIAHRDPHRTFTSIANSGKLEDGFTDITFSQLAKAVDYLAHQFKSFFGTSSHGSDTLTYLGVIDIRKSFQSLADKCQKVFLPSPRNPAAINISLMDQIQSTKLVHSEEVLATIHGICDKKSGLKCLQLETVDELLEHRADRFEWAPSFEQAKDDPILVLHSSGSTGYPKPIISTHRSFTVIDNDHKFPGVAGRINNDFSLWDFKVENARMYDAFPPFHLAGFAAKVMVPLYFNVSNVFGPSLRPPSGALTIEIIQTLDVIGAYLPPVIVEQIFREPNGLSVLKRLHVLCYAGGPLSPDVGDELAKSITICQFYGSAEVGQVRQLVPEQEDWSYLEFNPHNSLEFQPGDDDAFELVVFADETTKDFCALDHNVPGVNEWRTKDLFKPHPTKTGLWKFHGRKDDIIVLSSGEKLNPVPMEMILNGQDSVTGAILIGKGRHRPTLMVEPKLADEDPGTFIEGIWSAIEKGNALFPSFGRVLHSHVIIAKPDKPFVRAGKGTVVRRLTEVAYADEIEAHYATSGVVPSQISGTELELTATPYSKEPVMRSVRVLLQRVAPGIHFSDQENFYVTGLDSLQSTEVASLLRVELGKQRPKADLSWLSVDILYIHPSVESLSDALLKFLNKGKLPERRRDRVTEMRSVLDGYTKSLPTHEAPRKIMSKSKNLTIVLTGSTGSFGKILLKRMLKSPAISDVICLNRSTDAEQKWQAYCAVCNENLNEAGKQVRFITASFGKPKLGLSDQDFQSLAESVDVILHNAWKVDFNQSLSSFTDNLRSVRTLIDLSYEGKTRPRIVFISSISSCGPWGPAHTVEGLQVPETPITDLNASITDMGYGESKQVAENMLHAAALRSGVPITVIRAGQIAAPSLPSKGGWPGQELIPGIVQTLKSLRMVPSDYHEVDWVPIDHLASIVLELSSFLISTHPESNASPTSTSLILGRLHG
ncbi:putative NRPS-like enzyme [Viridothelium virens]|uniref:Putative NRPS-like enzyme n=1 Tax=Viridothelium virens TaxID=1048519 RepID=A0A6A6HGU3_VIRVR|nr:putative NRPS-like enzyme [Viridothelium virens]